MRREELAELHYITPITNLPSILKHGIQSHRRVEAARAKGLQSESIALQGVQDIRAAVQVPNGRPLHEYANLYICARNPMMFKRKEHHKEICVLRVAPSVLDIAGAVVTDQNAATKFARFEPAPDGLILVDTARVFADDWRHPGDELAYRRHRAVKCAEVLVPDKVSPDLLVGVYASCDEAQQTISSVAQAVRVDINREIFFL